MKRRGVAIPTAMVLLAFFFMFVMSLMQFSSQEMDSVKTLSEKKRAEYLAYSGVNWASVKLLAGRWWVLGKGFNPLNKIPRATGGTTVLEPFGPGGGKVYIIAEEFESANPTPLSGYKNTARLDHIRVYSIGQFNKAKVMVYGKFIMSPEPLLNSDSTEGAEVTTAPVAANGNVIIKVPQPWAQDGPVPEKMIVQAINVLPGAKVDPNTILATLGSHPSDPVQITMTWDIKIPSFGKLTKVLKAVGDMVRADDLFAECTDELMTATRSNTTLRKMVRITKISNREILDLDLTDFNTRRKKLDPFLASLSFEYVTNYAKNLKATEDLEKTFQSPPLNKLVPQAEILNRLKSIPASTTLSPEKSGNQFLDDMMSKWVVPGLEASVRADFPNKSEYHLAIGKSTPRSEIMEVLMKFGRLGEIQTAPKKNNELYKILGTDRYRGYMKPDVDAKVKDFIDMASLLKDGAKTITILFDKGTPLEDGPFHAAVASGTINPADYWWWNSKQGWYTKPDITIESVEIPYNYVNKSGKPFSMEVGFVLNYLRKHHDEGMALPPSGTIRSPSDQNDEPQAPGPPDSTGCKYSGVSS